MQHLNYYLSYDVCACFHLSFCKKKFFIQNGSNSQIRWTDISNSRIQAWRAWFLVLYKVQTSFNQPILLLIHRLDGQSCCFSVHTSVESCPFFILWKDSMIPWKCAPKNSNIDRPLCRYLPHCLGMNYCVNVLGGIGNNGFHTG